MTSPIFPPSISTLSPPSGTSPGGTTVTITGTNLTGATVVKFGTTTAASFHVTSPTTIKATTPAHPSGTVMVSVTTPGGKATKTGFTFVVPPPSISNLTPTSGTSLGGTPVTITGTNLTAATVVKFGTTTAASFHVTSPTTIKATTPAHPSGTVMVSVTTPGGTAAKTGFTFTPASCPPHYSGAYTGAVDSTSFGTQTTSVWTTTYSSVTGPATFTSHIAVPGLGANLTAKGTISCQNVSFATASLDTARYTGTTTPLGFNSSGTFTAGGGVSGTWHDQLATTKPSINSITVLTGSDTTPEHGPIIEIHGTKLFAASSVRFGSTTATNLTVTSPTTIRASVPASQHGKVSVSVTTPGGTGYFTWTGPAPSISSLTPPLGISNGGTTVTITGQGLLGASAVTFGTATAASFTVVGATEIKAVTEPHTTGTVAVSVTTPDGTATKATAFAFVTSTTTLYVAPAGTGLACTKSAPCPTIQDAISRAESVTFTAKAVTIAVAAGTYVEDDFVTAKSLTSLTIRGAGTHGTTMAGSTTELSLYITGGTVTISGITITYWSSAVDNSGSLTLADDTFSKGGDSTYDSGAIYNLGALTLTDDTFSNNDGHLGGGVYNTSTAIATVTDDTFSNDSGYFGGVYNTGKATVADDTFSNDNGYFGGGVANWGTATLTDDSFSNDSGNYGGGGVTNNNGTLTVSDSILNSASCSGTITDGGHNVETGDSCGFGTTSLNTSTTINLATKLAANGSTGPQTLAIGPTSSAFEEVPAVASATSTDERGDPRPGVSSQTRCDAGAFEYQGTQPATSITSVTPARGPVFGGTTVTITGTNFLGATSVHFGTTPAARFTVVGSTEIRATTEPHTTGTVAVSVTTTTGTLTKPTAFTFVTSTTTLYVTPAGTGLACVQSAPCPTIQDAISRAESQTFTTTSVTVDVASGTYQEHDTITAKSLTSLDIRGARTHATTVTGTTSGRDFTVSGGTVAISGLTITKGSATSGAGVFSGAGADLTLTDDTVSDDAYYPWNYGGGVDNRGTLTAADDTFSDINVGGIANLGTATFADDTFSNDDNSPGTVGVNNLSGTLTVSDSILDSATCSGTITDGGHNVETGDSCGFGTTSLNTSTTINLATTLAANTSTGPQTLAIGPTSSAFEEVPAAACTTSTDERGDPRPGVSSQTRCDAGAFEYQGTQSATSITSVAPSFGIAGGGTIVTITGLSLLGTSAVHFGTTPAASFTVVGATEVQATTEAHQTGTVAVSVTTATGTATDPHAYTYVTSTTTLYVTPAGTGLACVQRAPCPTIQGAITRAESQTFTAKAVTIDVASGTYQEHDTITAKSLTSLDILGARTTRDHGHRHDIGARLHGQRRHGRHQRARDLQGLRRNRRRGLQHRPLHPHAERRHLRQQRRLLLRRRRLGV